MREVVIIDKLTHSYPPSRRQYKPRIALNNITFTIQHSEVFCLLGPNGSGKSTLFRILSTLLRPTSGIIKIFDLDLIHQTDNIRHIIGVVFQNPSVDKKLTVRENLVHQGHLYNLSGNLLNDRILEMLTKVKLLDRADDVVEKLSGGLQRRVELAKAMLNKPRLLILDEPSTGLDPGARRDFDNHLQELRTVDSVTVLLTSHILEEAERCDRIAILDQGNVVALGSPQKLKEELGGDIISITSKDPETLSLSMKKYFHSAPHIIDGIIRIERQNGHEFIPELVQAFPGQIDTVTLSKPTLEDVFIQKTGHRFWENGK
ncbi:MAG: ABC transporter ATP-binding protein [Ignavibacteriae bacterium]|nr:ABC transporter ATP-binding protein [Ignavibacteriota bacterium]